VAQFADTAATRADERYKWAQQNELAKKADKRAEAVAEREASAAAESDAAGYLTTITGDWRNDQVARGKLQKAWEASGNTGIFDETWADNFSTSVRMTPADKWYNDYITSSAYLSAPPTTTYAADGTTVVTLGQDLMLQAASAIRTSTALGAMAIGKGPNGGACVYNPADGTIIAGDGAGTRMAGIGTTTTTTTGTGITTGTGGVTTYDNTVPTAVSAAVTAFTAADGVGAYANGVTDASMAQYLASHGNTLPASDTEWNTWSLSTRTYDTDSPEDLRAAYNAINDEEAMDDYTGPSITTETVSLWLSTHGGKIGDIDTFKTWAKDIGNTENIHNFMSNPDGGFTLSGNDTNMIAKATKANTLVTQKDALSPYEYNQLAKDNGFENAEEMEWYSENVIEFNNAPAVSNTPPWAASLVNGRGEAIPAQRIYGQVLNASKNGSFQGADITLHQANNRTVVETLPPDNATSWAIENAGKAVTINGSQYVLASEAEQRVYGQTAGGGQRNADERWDDQYTLIPGFRAYDVAKQKWVVLSPYNWESHKVVGENVGLDVAVTTRIGLADSNWGVYEENLMGDIWQPTPAQ
jgi:hypothetical protein